MKLNANNTHSEMQGVGVSEASVEPSDNATAGNVAFVVGSDTSSALLPQKLKQQFSGNLLLKQRRILGNDAESATDSSEHFTETDHQQTPEEAKHRHKTLKRKRDLINLQSNLSPKYIGYANANSPISVHESDDKVRSTRRRNHAPAANSSFELHGQGLERESDADTASPKPSLTNPHMYLSPIDKLLIKNGANSPNSTGFEADAEDVSIIQSSRKQQKQKLKRGPRSKTKQLAEVTDKEAGTQIIVNEHISEESSPTIENDKPDMEIKVELTDVAMATDEREHVQAEVETVKEEGSESIQVDMMFALPPVATSTEIESIKSSPDLLKAPNNSEQSVKSPSSISIDSAKGSSISAESSWPSYQIGDLYWGKLFNYCYWPCMVCPDDLDQIVGNWPMHPQRRSTDSAQGTNMSIQVHVRFFADNGRHNWIKSENLLPFHGLKAFEGLREEVRLKHGAKSAKFQQMVAKQNKLLVWRQAIEEAQIVSQMPEDLRLDKFFEIHANNVSLNKKKRKLSRHIRKDTSDVGSSLYDSTDNLHAKPHTQLEMAVKRERSSSPLRPSYSPVKVNHERRAKRRKLTGGDEAPVGSSRMSEAHDEKPSVDVVNYENPEFGELFQAIREYVLVHHQEEKVEKALLAVVQNIWSLKQIQLREMERALANDDTEFLGSTRLESESGRGVGTIKRLSNRLKTMVLRRSLTPVVSVSTTPTSLKPQTPTDSIDSELQSTVPAKLKKPVGRPIEEVIEDIMHLDRKYLFRGLNREPVCKYCHEPGGDIGRCSLACNSWMHAACLEQKKTAGKLSTKATSGRKSNAKLVDALTTSSPTSEIETVNVRAVPHITGDVLETTTETETKPLICRECAIGKPEPCCICHEDKLPTNLSTDSPLKEPAAAANLIVCSHPMCTNKFHPSCCKYWPQASINNSSSRCPMHVCHTCVSDDPSGKYQQLGNAKLIKCVKCPATYHQDSRCIPAGSRMLTTTRLICPRHNNISKADANLNVLWCYICVRGGELVCCETCPNSVHAHCRNIPIKTNESYICEECESGRLPLYGEIVWAKFNNFRWWPAIILPPTEIPNNIQKKPHGQSDFVVRFFGTHDHGWISRRRVYLYIEGDTGDGNKSKSLMSKRYTAGVEEATHFLKILKEKRHEQAVVRLNGNKLHPPPYVKIKANKPVPPVRFAYNEEDVNICECKAGSEHPCGPESGCLNRMLFHECNPEYCQARDQCENRMFEQRKSPRLEVVYMNDRGFGLVCREPITEGTFIIEYVGEVINHSEFQRRMAQKTSDRDENYYFLGVEKDFIIDAGPKGNLARFMNHSCEPNCETQKWTVNCINRVGIFAIKDIPENTELTFNYLWDDLMNNGKKACYCGAKRCSGEIGGKLKDEEIKESGIQTGKSKMNPKLKHKGIKIQVAAAKKKLAKKSKSVLPESLTNPETVDKEE